jgi:NTP pyrophosphatase (non-canonical NTP hydrolase)
MMKELQELVARSVEARGYREGWTDGMFAARQICKAVEELAELATAIEWKLKPPAWIAALDAAATLARLHFDGEDETGWLLSVDIDVANWEAPDVAIPLLVLADVLGIDLGAAIQEKVTGDVARGVRGERPEVPMDVSRKATALEWSSDMPTEPGFWWWRGDEVADASVVRVVERRGEFRFCFPGNTNRFGVELGQWAGPLVPPAEVAE